MHLPDPRQFVATIEQAAFGQERVVAAFSLMTGELRKWRHGHVPVTWRITTRVTMTITAGVARFRITLNALRLLVPALSETREPSA